MLEFLQLSVKVRFATEPDNPGLIRRYLDCDPGIHLPSKQQRRQHLAAQFELLLETVADERLPTHWRYACLDQMYRPLTLCQRLVDGRASRLQVVRMASELRTVSHYFRGGAKQTRH